MKLLLAATSGYLDNNLVVPDEARPTLLQASLLISSATVLARRINPNSQLFGFDVSEVIDADKNKLTEQIWISKGGVLDGKFDWLQRMFWGLNLLHTSVEITAKTDHIDTAQRALPGSG